MQTQVVRKAVWIKGKFLDVEELIKVAKSQAAKMGMKGKIIVVDPGKYDPVLDGQPVVLDAFGGGYNTPGSGSKKPLEK